MSNKKNNKIKELETYIENKINVNTFNRNINNIVSERNDLVKENINVHKDNTDIDYKINKSKNYNNILKIRENDFNKYNTNIINFYLNISNNIFNKKYKLIQKNWFVKNNKTYITLTSNTIDNKFNGWYNTGFFYKNDINNIDSLINKEIDLNKLNITKFNIHSLIKDEIISTNCFNKASIYEENIIKDDRYTEYLKDFKNLSVRYLYLKIENKNKDNYIIFKIKLDYNLIEIKEIVININDNLLNYINKLY